MTFIKINEKILAILAFLLLLNPMQTIKEANGNNESQTCFDEKTKEIVNANSALYYNYESQYRMFSHPLRIVCPNETNISIRIKYVIAYILGFNVRSRLRLVEIDNNNNNDRIKPTIYIRFSYFDFYKSESIEKSNLIDMSSTNDLISGFYGLKNVSTKDLLQLYDGFESIF